MIIKKLKKSLVSDLPKRGKQTYKSFNASQKIDYDARLDQDDLSQALVDFGKARNFIAEEGDYEAYKEEIETNQARNNKAKQKTLSYVISFPRGEKPSKEVMDAIYDEFVEMLGYEDHKSLYTIHNDTDNTHMHILIDAINPNTGKKHNVKFEYKAIRDSLSSMEEYFQLNKTSTKQNEHIADVFSSNKAMESEETAAEYNKAHQYDTIYQYMLERKDELNKIVREKGANWQVFSQNFCKLFFNLFQWQKPLRLPPTFFFSEEIKRAL